MEQVAYDSLVTKAEKVPDVKRKVSEGPWARSMGSW